MERTQLGSFTLRHVIGSGGMAEVWRGVHVLRAVPVAVKVMTGDKARGAKYREMFDNEVRAMAGLTHPGIAHVYDYGVVDRDAQESSGGRLVAGSPYLVMELAGGGTLAQLSGPVPFREIRRILRALLDALAHAHARGVVHRDLKPANILVGSEQDLRPGIKLADFGLAHPVETHAGSRRISGTPHFMSPEQFKGAWRDYGPWTDLYALGVLAYQLSTGILPFPWQTFQELRTAHLEEEPLELRPRMRVPEGFTEWVGRLLEKRPSRRYRRAADAAWDLDGLAQVPDELLDAPSMDDSPSSALHTHGHTLVELIHGQMPEVSEDVQVETGNGPPILPSWRRPEDRAAMDVLVAGPGLVGLRTLPFVGRESERDRIWEALREVRELRQQRLLWVSGPAGVGKRRLVRWMCERAHELGAATVLRATHDRIPGPSDGIPGLLSRMFRCPGLPRAAILKRTQRSLKSLGLRESADWHAVAELILSGTEEGAHLAKPSERHRLIERLLRARAQVRPLIVWIDDVQWGPDALDAVRFLMSVEDDAPLLVLLTGREAPDGRVHEALELLVDQPAAQRIRVGPLEPVHQRDLVKRLLGLEPALADEVIARTDGTPLFAVQLVGDWVARGHLVPSAEGWVLAPGAEPELPDDVHQLFVGRLKRALGDDPRAIEALEVAAVLGRRAEEAEWRAACWHAGAVIRPDHVRRLVAAGLLAHEAEGEGQAWRFEQSMLRESLERSARDNGRLAGWHRACAAAIDELYPAEILGSRERIGRHLVAAGDHEQAIGALFAAAAEARTHSQYPAALALLDVLDATLDSAAVATHDERRGQADVLRATLFRYQGRFEQARKLAERIESEAQLYGWPNLAARAVELLGNLARIKRDLPTARLRLEAALRMFRDLGDRSGTGTAMLGLAAVLWQTDQLDEAEELFQLSLIHHRESDSLSGVADSLNGLAELARTRGRLDRAEALYQEAMEMHRLTHSGIELVVRLNLCLVRILQGRYAEVVEDLETILDLFERQGRQTYMGAVHVLLLPACAERGDWEAWDRHFGAGLGLITEAGMIDKDIAWPAQLAGDLAAERAQPQRAWQAYVLARQQWKAIGNDERAAEAQASMRAVS